ncbi:dTDP-4-dehydrorhamnose 3,5-epimerase [Pararhodospirillum oryzae]|uniref:dTDP-4-dehydrorhamnose 3,5-epimerase n=1 Tax=Pararhodospirillum oryzae TaxID=478448 RepID=A0A512H7T2_9PROT|nr:dTDP-4-dehydrorhamnose 3,5-epimerase [Pararhodospirillum oryzae]GEO81515.1 dTDP-4-dehydrorhamnose 3,5-epimerase [Pararhodospirillum oryzae]
MYIERLPIPDVFLITPRRFSDARGFFSETWNRRLFHEITGLDPEFVQDNHSLSRERGTVRGLHYQAAPQAQAKLVRVPRGAIMDVAVDLRRESPTFGRSVWAILGEENGTQMYVPEGFAHGFCTLETNTEVIYKVTSYYAPDCDRSLHWKDPVLSIPWPDFAGSILSDKDSRAPSLAKLTDFF